MITELDGLAKGQDNFGGGVGSGGRSTGSRGNYNVSAGHVRAVQEKARLAVAFLEKGFEAREPYLRALTSRGSQLESIAFRSEDTSGQQVISQINGVQNFFFHFILLYYLLVIWSEIVQRNQAVSFTGKRWLTAGGTLLLTSNVCIVFLVTWVFHFSSG